MAKRHSPGDPPATPSREKILAFIAREREAQGANPQTIGKREIARAFGLKGADRIGLKKILRELEAEGEMPRLQVIRLPQDHTSGTTIGKWTPTACVAENDLALGMLVEAVSKSKFWAQTAIFVVEDDAQNGPDHVDAHRTVGLVISQIGRAHV